ncbi:unnamed protein product [Ixodes pacificus]
MQKTVRYLDACQISMVCRQICKKIPASVPCRDVLDAPLRFDNFIRSAGVQAYKLVGAHANRCIPTKLNHPYPYNKKKHTNTPKNIFVSHAWVYMYRIQRQSVQSGGCTL